MKSIAMLLTILTAALAWQFRSSAAIIATQRVQIDELSAKLAKRTATETLDLQERCAKQAFQAYKLAGWEKNERAVFSNHFNGKLNRCFLLMEDNNPEKGTVNVFLSDAYEGKYFGSYMWMARAGKKFWEVKPAMCEVAENSGRLSPCASREEFDALTKTYME